MKIPAASSPVQGSPERPRQFTSSTTPFASSVAQTRSATLTMSAGDRKYKDLGEHNQIEHSAGHSPGPASARSEPTADPHTLARGRQRWLDDIHRQQSVAAGRRASGSAHRSSSRPQSQNESAGCPDWRSYCGISLFICARAKLPRVRTCVIEALKMLRRVTYDRRSWQQERLPRLSNARNSCAGS